MKPVLVWIGLALLGLPNAHAEEKRVALADAPGRKVVEDNCAACHSLDYVRTNSPFLDRKDWQGEVNKMINAFGAPIAPDDTRAIADYLVGNYGTGE